MFEMETSRDLLAALHDDLAAFASEPNSSRLAFHCATTAYHLHDWIWHEYLEKGGLRQGALLNWCEHFGKRKDFSAWISQRFPKFQALADLVNGGKHLNQSYANKGVVVGQPQFMFGVPGAGMGQGRWGEPTPYDPAAPQAVFPMVSLSDALGGGEVAAWLVVKEAVDFWNDFFEKHVPH